MKAFLFPTLLHITAVAVLVGILKEKGYGLCTDPQKLDEKSNDWRSVFLWLNTLLNLKRKLRLPI